MIVPNAGATCYTARPRRWTGGQSSSTWAWWTGEAIVGANVVRDFFAKITDIVGGRSHAYESKLADARELAFQEMMHKAQELGANGIIGIDIDYGVLGENSGMLLVSVNGTAVVYGHGVAG